MVPALTLSLNPFPFRLFASSTCKHSIMTYMCVSLSSLSFCFAYSYPDPLRL